MISIDTENSGFDMGYLTLTLDELAALEGLPYIQRLTYLMGIKPYMDYKTNVVGIKRRISYQSLDLAYRTAEAPVTIRFVEPLSNSSRSAFLK